MSGPEPPAPRRGWLPSRVQVLIVAAVAVAAIFGAAGLAALLGRPAATVRDPVLASSPAPTPRSELPGVTLAELPAQAREALARVDRGGPYPYRQDGTVFGNEEGRLPGRPAGYYREYTVVTPGSPDRGARRLVVGAAGDVYYTADHYASFRQVLR